MEEKMKLPTINALVIVIVIASSVFLFGSTEAKTQQGSGGIAIGKPQTLQGKNSGHATVDTVACSVNPLSAAPWQVADFGRYRYLMDNRKLRVYNDRLAPLRCFEFQLENTSSTPLGFSVSVLDSSSRKTTSTFVVFADPGATARKRFQRSVLDMNFEFKIQKRTWSH